MTPGTIRAAEPITAPPPARPRDDGDDDAPWRGMFTDLAVHPPAGWRLPPESERPAARAPVPNLSWLPDRGDEDE